MPSEKLSPPEDRLRIALEATARQRAAYRSAVIAAHEHAKAILAAGGGAERAALELGRFGGARIDAARFAALTHRTPRSTTRDAFASNAAANVLRALAAGDDGAFVVDVPRGGDLRSAVAACASPNSDARSALRRRSSWSAPDASKASGTLTSIETLEFEQWGRSERRAAPPLVVRVDGADLHAGGLADFLDGAVHIVLVVDGPCAPAPLVRLVTPGTFVLQTADATGARRLREIRRAGGHGARAADRPRASSTIQTAGAPRGSDCASGTGRRRRRASRSAARAHGSRSRSLRQLDALAERPSLEACAGRIARARRIRTIRPIASPPGSSTRPASACNEETPMLSPLIRSVEILGGVGLVFAIFIALAYWKLRVWEDPRIDAVAVDAARARTAARAGFPGCRGFAEQAVAGKVAAGRLQRDQRRGRRAHRQLPRRRRRPGEQEASRGCFCAGGSNVAMQQAEYRGLRNCARGGGGRRRRQRLRVGLPRLRRLRHGVHVRRDHDESISGCRSSTRAVHGVRRLRDACPKDLFEIVPLDQKLLVQCKSLIEGDEALASCAVACTACGKCVADAAPGLITHRARRGPCALRAATRSPTPSAIAALPDGSDRLARGRAIRVATGRRRRAGTHRECTIMKLWPTFAPTPTATAKPKFPGLRRALDGSSAVVAMETAGERSRRRLSDHAVDADGRRLGGRRGRRPAQRERPAPAVLRARGRARGRRRHGGHEHDRVCARRTSRAGRASPTCTSRCTPRSASDSRTCSTSRRAR